MSTATATMPFGNLSSLEKRIEELEKQGKNAHRKNVRLDAAGRFSQTETFPNGHDGHGASVNESRNVEKGGSHFD